MEHIKCFNCGEDIEINIANAVDEDGEVFKCKKCGKTFRYTKE